MEQKKNHITVEPLESVTFRTGIIVQFSDVTPDARYLK